MNITLNPRYELHDHQGAVRELGVHSDGKLFFARSDDMLVIYDLENGTKLQGFYDSDGYSAASFGSNDQILIYASGDNIHYFDVRCWHEHLVFAGEMSEHRDQAACIDSRLMAIGDESGSIKVYKLGADADDEPLFILDGHKGYIEYLMFHPGTRLLVSGASDKTIRFWDMEKIVEIASFQVHNDSVTAVAFSPDGLVMVSSDYGGKVKVWDLAIKK